MAVCRVCRPVNGGITAVTIGEKQSILAECEYPFYSQLITSC